MESQGIYFQWSMTYFIKSECHYYGNRKGAVTCSSSPFSSSSSLCRSYRGTTKSSHLSKLQHDPISTTKRQMSYAFDMDSSGTLHVIGSHCRIMPSLQDLTLQSFPIDSGPTKFNISIFGEIPHKLRFHFKPFAH